MSLKSRIEKLEQSHGIDAPHKLIIFSMYDAHREPTEAEVEALKKSLNWNQTNEHLVLWNGERFFDNLDDYREAENPLTEAELAERSEKRLAEIRAGYATPWQPERGETL
jgi:hypothetical protein